MNRVYTFDLPVDDMERARKFYEEVFGWEIAPIPGSGGNYHSAITVHACDGSPFEGMHISRNMNGSLLKKATLMRVYFER